MEEELWVEPIDPHMYCGIALDCDEETIPLAIARHLRERGELVCWRFQAGWNHDHPSLMGLDDIGSEIATFDAWVRILSERFPDEQFVIEQDPFSVMTWYQPFKGAPTEDEVEWKPYQEPVSIDLSGMKERAQDLRAAFEDLVAQNRLQYESDVSSRVVLDSRIHPGHRGVKIGTVEGTGEVVVTATRCIRTVIGP